MEPMQPHRLCSIGPWGPAGQWAGWALPTPCPGSKGGRQQPRLCCQERGRVSALRLGPGSALSLPLQESWRSQRKLCGATKSLVWAEGWSRDRPPNLNQPVVLCSIGLVLLGASSAHQTIFRSFSKNVFIPVHPTGKYKVMYKLREKVKDVIGILKNSTSS